MSGRVQSPLLELLASIRRFADAARERPEILTELDQLLGGETAATADDDIEQLARDRASKLRAARRGGR